MRRFLLILSGVLALCNIARSADLVYEMNANCRNAYQAAIELRLTDAARILSEEKKANPNNLIPVYLENYIDFFELFFNEDPDLFARRKHLYEDRLKILAKGPESSPYHLFTRSAVHLQWAFVYIKFGKHWDGGWSFRRSFLQAKENASKFPAFSPSQMYLGAMETAAGTIPEGYRWLSGLLGIRGTIESGMKRLSTFINADQSLNHLYRDEAIFYYLYLSNYVLNDRKGVFDFMQSRQLDLTQNHLFAYMAANLSLNNQRSKDAENIINSRKKGSRYLQTPVWDFEMGYSKLYQLEPEAGAYFVRFIQQFRGRYYVKDALQKLSWHYYLNGNVTEARRYRQMILQKGTTDTEADKQAHKEAKTDRWPNPLLLKARLLNDGGNNREALGLLHGKSINDFTLPEEKLEFAYRAARLFDDTGKEEQAISYYKLAIDLGENRTEYFAARAALQLGFLYERQGRCLVAAGWFRKCLSLKDHDYKNSLDQKAKAGLMRCAN